MAMTYYATQTSAYRQFLRNLGPGCLCPAGDVSVYRLRKDGARGQLLRIDPPTFFLPQKLGKPFKKKGG